MYAQTNYGMYSRCLNMQCRKPYSKTSHRGFLCKSPTEVFVVMQCQECKASHVLVQLVMLAHDYYKRLPAAITPHMDQHEITAAEVRKARKLLDSDAALRLLSESLGPDPHLQSHDE